MTLNFISILNINAFHDPPFATEDDIELSDYRLFCMLLKKENVKDGVAIIFF